MRRPDPTPLKSPLFSAMAMFVGGTLLMMASVSAEIGPAKIAILSPSAVSPEALHVL